MNPTVLGFFRKELFQTLRDPRMRILLFVMPVIQMSIFGLAISSEIRNVKLAGVYEPGDAAFARLLDRCYHSRWFLPAQVDGADPFRWVQGGKADAVLLAPPKGLTRGLGRGLTEIQLLVDSSNINKAQVIEGYVRAILARELAEHNPQGGGPLPLRFTVRYLYNPAMETSIFMVPSVLCMILCLVTIVLTSSSVAREKEFGTFETLLASPATVTEILLGKSLPFVLLGMLDMPLVIAVARFGFNVPMRGSFFVLLFAAFFFMCNTVALGILLSTFVKNMQQTSLGSFFIIFPALQLSGVMYPVENMPKMLKFFAHLDPLMYFVALIRNIMLKGGDPRVLFTHIGALALMGTAAIALSFKRFHQTLN